MNSELLRLDHKVISEFILPNSSVLDLGCGEGELLEFLVKDKSVRAQGIEIDEQAIYKCVARGLSVFHGDIDTGLAEYSDKSFDYVILNQSLQQIKHVDAVFADALRVGKKVIVGIPNFAHYKARLQLFFSGRAPITSTLPYTWYETPNLRSLSISDFLDYCRLKKVKIDKAVYLDDKNRVSLFPNLFATSGILLISR